MRNLALLATSRGVRFRGLSRPVLALPTAQRIAPIGPRNPDPSSFVTARSVSTAVGRRIVTSQPRGCAGSRHDPGTDLSVPAVRTVMRRSRRVFLAGAVAVGMGGCLGSSKEDVIRLRTLEVAGSPGGTVPVRRPGTVTLVDFFATWCVPCRHQMATLGAVRSTFDGDELYLTSVTTETDESAIRDFWRSYDGRWPVLLDPDIEATRAYEVKGIPTLVIVGRAGEIHWSHRGLARESTLMRELREAIEG